MPFVCSIILKPATETAPPSSSVMTPLAWLFNKLMPTLERIATKFTKKSSSFSITLSLMIGTTMFCVLAVLVKTKVSMVALGLKSVALLAVPLLTK